MKLGIVTPVYQRFELTTICMSQRIDLLNALPFDAVQIIVGDEENHMLLAMELNMLWGAKFDWVNYPNNAPALGAKFNAGYQRAKDLGCTHVIAIGSDSWLHPLAFEGRDFSDKFATAMTGLSSFAPDGRTRLDLTIKYPAGFGVGMVYPVVALQDEPCDPTKSRGCDGSTWSRNGRGRLGVDFARSVPLSYTNFSSYENQVTSYAKVAKTHGIEKHGARVITGHAVFDELRPMYGDYLVDAIEGHYAARSIGFFLRGSAPPVPVTDQKPTVDMVRVGKEPLSVTDARRHNEARRKLRAARRDRKS